MFRNLNLKSRRIMSLIISFVLLISLTACGGAGNPTGTLKVDEVYAKAGNYEITKGQLWDELRWSAIDILEDKIIEVVLQDYTAKIEVVMEKDFASLTEDEKSLFGDDFTNENFNELKDQYTERLKDYVIADIYNFSFSATDYYDSIEDVKEDDAKVLMLEYADQMYSTYGINEINSTSIYDLCFTATKDNDNYLTLAKTFKELYYPSYAKELLAYSKLEEEIKEAYDERDTDDEDDLGYFTKSQYTTAYKNEYANKGDLNLILIRFASSDEYNSTLRSFGLKFYKDQLIYIGSNGTTSFSEYCDYYDDLTIDTSVDYQTVEDSCGEVAILELYIQMYNYLYGGYRDMLYTDAYASNFNNIDLRSVTESIIDKYAPLSDEERKAEYDTIVNTLNTNKDAYDFNTIYTSEYINNIAASFATYLYETLVLPFSENEDEDLKCYSTSMKTYNSQNWIAFKLEQGADEYDVYEKDITNDELYENIAANEELYAELTEILKREAITSTKIETVVEDEVLETSVKIYDEALEISYAAANSEYSKTYGKAPNKNVIATITYNDETYNLNIVEDTTDENALAGGVYDSLELRLGTTTAVDLLCQVIIKDTPEYEATKENMDDYYEQLEYALASFASDYFAQSGYPSTLGKYNFLMLYFHTADVEEIINNQYRISDASNKLLTNYNSDALLSFFKDYADSIYDNYFSITGKRLVVYLDADDDGEKDDVTTWTSYQKELAQELVLNILNKVSSLSGSHATALTDIVSEINNSARAKFEDNPIAPENEWAIYRKHGLNVALEDVTATNDTTNIDFSLKQRLYDIYKSDDFSVNDTAQTEYLEKLESKDDVLVTEDGYNLLLVTSATFKNSAEFDEEDDKLGLYENISIYYNEEYVNINNVYNTEEKLTLDQIKLYVLEYVSLGTNNLSPTTYATATSSYLSPVLTRFTGNETQRDIILHFIEIMAGSKLTFTDSKNDERLTEIIEINHNSADGYIEIYFAEDTTNTLKTYENWWTDVQSIVQDILLQGENK